MLLKCKFATKQNTQNFERAISIQNITYRKIRVIGIIILDLLTVIFWDLFGFSFIPP